MLFFVQGVSYKTPSSTTTAHYGTTHDNGKSVACERVEPLTGGDAVIEGFE